ncbi:MAG: 1-phosphofructokinase family hexose kinase, partial [Thermoanaerobaculia bacterium]
MKTIVTLTMSPALDMFLEVPRLVPGRKLRCESPLFSAGGGGINVSRAIHRLGGTATAVFPAGGSTGGRLVLLLQRENVPANVIRVEEPTREDINVVETGSGNEYRFVVPGAQLSHHEWEHCLRALRAIEPPPGIVVASGSLPRSVPVDFYA